MKLSRGWRRRARTAGRAVITKILESTLTARKCITDFPELGRLDAVLLRDEGSLPSTMPRQAL